MKVAKIIIASVFVVALGVVIGKWYFDMERSRNVYEETAKPSDEEDSTIAEDKVKHSESSEKYDKKEKVERESDVKAEKTEDLDDDFESDDQFWDLVNGTDRILKKDLDNLYRKLPKGSSYRKFYLKNLPTTDQFKRFMRVIDTRAGRKACSEKNYKKLEKLITAEKNRQYKRR